MQLFMLNKILNDEKIHLYVLDCWILLKVYYRLSHLHLLLYIRNVLKSVKISE